MFFVINGLTQLVDHFRLAAGNLQCKHTLLGCTYETVYVDLLAPYASDPLASSCITLVNSGSLRALLSHETRPFGVIDLYSLFEYPGTPPSEQDYDGAYDSRRVKYSLTNWLDHAGGIPPRAAKRPYSGWSTNSQDSELSWDRSNAKILLNVNDHRLDRPLDSCDSEILNSMTIRSQVQKFCHWHYLHKNCTNKGCEYRHEELNEEELKAVRMMARGIPCEQLGHCRKRNCHYGHICYRLPNCYRRPCPFADTHGEDRSIVHVC